MQDLCSRQWNPGAGFETIPPMASHEESPESTAAVAFRLSLTRQAFGMKKAVWCRFVGITETAWSNVEGTKNKPASNRISLDEALKVCRATGVGLDWIYRGDRTNMPVKVAMELQKLNPPAKKKTTGKKA
jgi:hypothetical protein